MRPVPLVLLLLVLLSPSALADTQGHWLQIKTDHFTVLCDGSERQARHTAAQLERMHAVFAKLLPHASDDPGSPILVLALRDRKDFQTVEPAPYLAKNALDLAGLFMRGDDRNYILLRLDTAGENPYATVYHEYTHYMTRHADYLPIWLNEGLAEFYQNTNILDRDVRLGQPDVNQIRFLREQRLIPLDTLFQIDYNSPYYHEGDKGNIFYAESWALTHFLFLSDFGKPEGRLYLYARYLQQGESSLAAAEHAFGDLKKLQVSFESYIRNGEYRALTMPLQTGVDEKGLQVEPIPNSDADAARADVLARNGRTRDAEALVDAVLASAPDNAQAHEAMGLIKLREGDMQAARKWYGEAVAMHSTSFLAFYYFGSLSMRDGRNAPETAADSLRESIKLNPHFAPALDALGQFDAMHDEHLDEALQMALRAVAQEPQNVQYRLNASEVRLVRKEYPSAISGLEATAKIARSAEDRERVQARLDQVKQYQDQTEKVAALREEGAREMAADAHSPHPAGPAAIRDAKGDVVHMTRTVEPDHKLPEGPPVGPKHKVSGTVHGVGCFYPKGMTLQLNGSGKAVSLYANDMYAVNYSAGNFQPKKVLNPCQDFDGLKATIVYAEVADPTVAGQIISMELNK